VLKNQLKHIKLDNQLQTAREVFSPIAEKQVDTNSKISDALVAIGTALEKFAENDKKRLENDKLILEVYT